MPDMLVSHGEPNEGKWEEARSNRERKGPGKNVGGGGITFYIRQLLKVQASDEG